MPARREPPEATGRIFIHYRVEIQPQVANVIKAQAAMMGTTTQLLIGKILESWAKNLER